MSHKTLLNSFDISIFFEVIKNTFSSKMAERQRHDCMEQEYIDYVGEKLFHLKSKIKLLKEEVNAKFMDFINSVFKQQSKLLAEIDDKLDDVITQTTEQIVHIVRLSEKTMVLSKSDNLLDKTLLNEVQNEIQEAKNKHVKIPEITIEWDSDTFKNSLDKIGKLETKEHPYTYMGPIKYALHQSETELIRKPKSFEIDWPSGDVYFLNNFEDKNGFDFSITAFDRFGAQKETKNRSFLCKFERKFCPIGMCLSQGHISVTATGKSAKTQLASITKELQSNKNEFKECILKIEKSSGNIERAAEIEGLKSIGQIDLEPKDELFYVIDHETSEMNVLDLELKKRRQFQLVPRVKGWISAAPKIEYFQISKDDIFIVYDKKPFLEIYNLSGALIRQLFDTFPDIYTIDPQQHIITIDSQSNGIQIWDTKGREVAKVAGKLGVITIQFHATIGIKFDILTGRILFCGISPVPKSKLGFVYL